VETDLAAVQERLLAGQDGSGGVQTATGFAAQVGGRLPALPDVRDLLHVTGWCDKAFRYWAGHVASERLAPAGELPEPVGAPTFESDCAFQGKAMRYRETATEIEVSRDGRPAYRWRKGAPWAEIATPEFWLR
jgi:hypothetical protein